ELFGISETRVLAFTSPGTVPKLIDLIDKQAYDITALPEWKWIGDRRYMGKASNRHGSLFLMPEGLDSIYHYDHKRNNVSALHVAGLERSALYWPASLVSVGDEQLALLLAQGGFILLQVSREDGSITRLPDILLPGVRCRHISRDREGRLWVAAEDGLYGQRLHPPIVQQATLPENLPGLMPQQEIHAICWHQGKPWIGLGGRGGVVALDPETLLMERQYRFGREFNQEMNEVFSLRSVHPDTLWLGTRRGIGWLNTRTGQMGVVQDDFATQNKPTILGIYQDKAGDRWLGLSDRVRGLLKYDPATGTFQHWEALQPLPGFPLASARHMVQDAYGNIWFAYMGLARYNVSKGGFDTLITRFAGQRPDETDILSMDADDEGNLWMVTTGNGSLQYNILQGTYKHYGLAEGLSTPALRAVSTGLKDWIVTAGRYDINLLHLPTERIYTWQQDEGVPERLLTTADLAVDPDRRRLIAGFHRSIAAIPIPPQTNISTFSSTLLLSELNIHGYAPILHPDGKLKIQYRQNNLDFRFTTLRFEGANNIKLFYKLNSDKDWLAIGPANELSLANLRPGTYRLQVEARSANGFIPVLNNEWEITIDPPWWQHPLFYFLVALLAASLLFVIIRWRINSIRKKATLNEKLADYEMKALHAQMNPHFVFNCLNSIKDMILTGENEQASRYLSKFARLIRQTLDQSKQNFITLGQTIDHLKDYLEMERIRFADIRYEMCVDPALDRDEIKLPPMLVQPLIENAIWHGLKQQTGDKKLEIGFSKKNDLLVCRVSDNGTGLNGALQQDVHNDEHLKIAIQNIRKRLLLINEKYGTGCRLTVENKIPDRDEDRTGVMATLELPL
ncbi:MAG TPA: histidine kinase, partial [Phnomibacter sp.]|nr:histidine kinase [Phnomibacter sp.]